MCVCVCASLSGHYWKVVCFYLVYLCNNGGQCACDEWSIFLPVHILNMVRRHQMIYTYTSMHMYTHTHTQPIQLTLPDVQSGISLDQRMTEAETYYYILQEQIQDITQTFNTTEEAKQIKDTAKTMMEALRQCIDVMKDSQLVELGSPSIEPTPSPPSPVGIPAAAPLESKALEVAMGGVKGEIKSSPDLLRVKRTKNASSSSESSSTRCVCVCAGYKIDKIQSNLVARVLE